MSLTEISTIEAGAFLTIDLQALVSNWQSLRAVCGEAECGAVVKADAYGLGLEPVAEALWKAGCKTFFVAHVFEGRSLRAIAPEAVIYVLNGLRPGSEPAYAEFDLRPVLCSVPEIEDWGQYCATSKKRAKSGGLLQTGFRVDCGLNRLGLKAYDRERAEHLAPLFELTLLLGELATGAPQAFIESQIEAFETIRLQFPNAPSSLANSTALFLDCNPPLYDLVRPGYALYGGNPVPGRQNPMRPVIRLEAQIIQVRILEPGQGIGEDQLWKAKGPRRVAVISAGLADGLPASLTQNAKRSGGGVLIQGKLCPFIGPISMDHSMIDVSDAVYVERGDSAELIGPALGIDEFALNAGLSGYEVLVELGRRCHRRYRPL
jgi:alanine racemase